MCESKVSVMSKKEMLDNMLYKKNGVLLTADVVEAGISKTYFVTIQPSGCLTGNAPAKK